MSKINTSLITSTESGDICWKLGKMLSTGVDCEGFSGSSAKVKR
jgi:hypothetical protein